MIKLSNGILMKASGLLTSIRSVGPRSAGTARQTQLYYEHLRQMAAKREARRIAEERASQLLHHPEQGAAPQVAPYTAGRRTVIPPNPTPKVEERK